MYVFIETILYLYIKKTRATQYFFLRKSNRVLLRIGPWL